jgi:hypothetical protein
VACQLDFVSTEVDAMEPMLPSLYDERTRTLPAGVHAPTGAAGASAATRADRHDAKEMPC